MLLLKRGKSFRCIGELLYSSEVERRPKKVGRRPAYIERTLN